MEEKLTTLKKQIDENEATYKECEEILMVKDQELTDMIDKIQKLTNKNKDQGNTIKSQGEKIAEIQEQLQKVTS